MCKTFFLYMEMISCGCFAVYCIFSLKLKMEYDDLYFGMKKMYLSNLAIIFEEGL